MNSAKFTQTGISYEIVFTLGDRNGEVYRFKFDNAATDFTAQGNLLDALILMAQTLTPPGYQLFIVGDNSLMPSVARTRSLPLLPEIITL